MAHSLALSHDVMVVQAVVFVRAHMHEKSLEVSSPIAHRTARCFPNKPEDFLDRLTAKII